MYICKCKCVHHLCAAVGLDGADANLGHDLEDRLSGRLTVGFPTRKRERKGNGQGVAISSCLLFSS